MTRTPELQQIRFRGQHHGPHLLITGGVHGDEFEPMVAIRRLIKWLDTDSKSRMSLRGCVTLIPVVNEPAFLRGNRTAEDGLDLARVCPGKADGSVTERIAHALSPLIRDADFYIDLHTGGTELAVLPFVGYKMHSDKSILDHQRRMAHAFNLPIIWGTNPNLDGRTLSVARDAGIPAIYAEFLGSATCDPQGVDAYQQGCLNVMAELEMTDRQQPESVIQTVIEDARPNAGHMQICNPSPMTGYFQPAVQLGDEVRIGDPLGSVCDSTGEKEMVIRSQQHGIVLVLRTFPRVRQGETVGLILERESK